LGGIDVPISRDILLAGSTNVWLREHAMRWPFVRRSVARFMPGERMEDALEAGRELEAQGPGTLLTHLGENLTSLAEADGVTAHYLQVLDAIQAKQLNMQISLKPTQLGLDLDAERCYQNLMQVVVAAEAKGNFVWIDMESTPYVDPTLALFRRARASSARVGICLQAYLYRTAADIEALLPIGPAVRLVKGAYREPPNLAYPKKADVDQNFFALAARLLTPDAQQTGAFLGIGTHDTALVRRLQAHAVDNKVPQAAYEFEMLYGIQRPLQMQLVHEGARLRVLISYGEYWFPWYMRRLAERPANVWFVMKNMF
jgi:proline dehydrogenase